jgi:hypothetical protein
VARVAYSSNDYRAALSSVLLLTPDQQTALELVAIVNRPDGLGGADGKTLWKLCQQVAAQREILAAMRFAHGDSSAGRRTDGGAEARRTVALSRLEEAMKEATVALYRMGDAKLRASLSDLLPLVVERGKASKGRRRAAGRPAIMRQRFVGEFMRLGANRDEARYLVTNLHPNILPFEAAHL